MIGKIILWVLLAILLLLVLLLMIPVTVRVSYEDGALELWCRYGPVKLRLLPGPEKEEPRKKKKPAPKKKKGKEKKPKARINLEQILYALENLPPILGRALRRVGRSIRIQPLKVHLLVAGDDPASTALLYGRLGAALSAGLPSLERVVEIREEDVRLFLDFQEERMDVIADVGVRLRPGTLVWIALRAGVSLLKWFLGFRKLASPPPENQKEKKSDMEHKQGENEEAA